MKQKLIILLILSLVLVGNAVADTPPDPTNLVSDTPQSGHVLWSWVAGAGAVTDSYNVSVDSVWYNSTTSTSYDDNVGNGATSTIIVWAYNSTGSGNLSAKSITGSKRGIIQFNGVTDSIESAIPIFGALQDLIVAVVPYLLTLIVVTGIITLIGFLFKRERVFR